MRAPFRQACTLASPATPHGEACAAGCGMPSASISAATVSQRATPWRVSVMRSPAAFFCRAVKAVKHKIAQAVDNRLAAIGFCALGDMRMAAHHGIGAVVDHQPRQLALAGAGRGFPFPPQCMNGITVGPGSARARMSLITWAFAPGNARLLGAGLE